MGLTTTAGELVGLVPLNAMLDAGRYYYGNDADVEILDKDFKELEFLDWCDEFSKINDFRIRRAEGAGGYLIKKRDWDYIGGNDPLFAPASWEDMDLFIRMQLEGYKFVMSSKSVVYHFSARGSHFRDEAKDKLNSKSKRQQESESNNAQKFIKKWGRLPQSDDQTFVIPIEGTNNPNRIPLL